LVNQEQIKRDSNLGRLEEEKQDISEKPKILLFGIGGDKYTCLRIKR
jgi:hypothetical protein